MPLSTKPLTTLLTPYPALSEALGPDWIAQQDTMDPIQSPFSLARWLRMDGFGSDLSTMDRVLRELRDIPGMKERRQRMRSDPLALMETLTELYFGAWLLHRGISFDLPKTGADFKVHLGKERFLHIEATTLRIARWTQDLFERLDLVGQRTGYFAHVEHHSETPPDTSLSVEIVSTIVTDALEVLAKTESETTGGRSPQIVKDYPEYRTRITWTPSSDPGVGQTTVPEPTSPYTMFYRLVSAARGKARQLPDNEAGILLLGTEHLPQTQLSTFEDALLYEDIKFDWTQIPNQIKYIILYSFELKRVEPFDAKWLMNPLSTLPDTPGTMEFLQNLFPYLLRSNDDPDPSSD